jgi:hypothetical protein
LTRETPIEQKSTFESSHLQQQRSNQNFLLSKALTTTTTTATAATLFLQSEPNFAVQRNVGKKVFDKKSKEKKKAKVVTTKICVPHIVCVSVRVRLCIS